MTSGYGQTSHRYIHIPYMLLCKLQIPIRTKKTRSKKTELNKTLLLWQKTRKLASSTSAQPNSASSGVSLINETRRRRNSRWASQPDRASSSSQKRRSVPKPSFPQDKEWSLVYPRELARARAGGHPRASHTRDSGARRASASMRRAYSSGLSNPPPPPPPCSP